MANNVKLDENEKKIHENLLLHLLAVRQRLMTVDPQSLTLDEQIEWNEQVYQVGLAISAMEGAILTAISEDYAKTLPNIEKAADKLTDDLYKLKAANDVITAIGSVLGTISSIAVLLG